jgi:hypothetical protein
MAHPDGRRCQVAQATVTPRRLPPWQAAVSLARPRPASGPGSELEHPGPARSSESLDCLNLTQWAFAWPSGDTQRRPGLEPRHGAVGCPGPFTGGRPEYGGGCQGPPACAAGPGPRESLRLVVSATACAPKCTSI